MTHADSLLARIANREAVVGIVGLGYTGLPLARTFIESGFRVVGFDIDPAKIAMLSRGETYLKHLGDDLAAGLLASGRFTATSDPAGLAGADAVLLCVPTPLGPARVPDLSFVENSTRLVASILREGSLVILTSTSYPGTTREACLPILNDAHPTRLLGRDLFLAFSPEREDPGRKGVTTRTIPRLVGGLDPQSGRVARTLLAAAVDTVIEVESAEIAEAAKLLENIYRAVNIAMVNELKPVMESMGIDLWKVIDAAATKPFGFQPFYPGPGLGGHCIPIDPFYLTWKAREHGCATRFIELAGEINSAMPHHVVERLTQALNDDAKPLRRSRILMIGLAYKPDVDDVRETPAAEIIRLLLDRGAEVGYHDPHVPCFPMMRRYRFDLRSVPLTPEALHDADAVLIVTAHTSIDWDLIGREACLVVDTRNAMARVRDPLARIVKA